MYFQALDLKSLILFRVSVTHLTTVLPRVIKESLQIILDNCILLRVLEQKFLTKE